MSPPVPSAKLWLDFVTAAYTNVVSGRSELTTNAASNEFLTTCQPSVNAMEKETLEGADDLF